MLPAGRTLCRVASHLRFYCPGGNLVHCVGLLFLPQYDGGAFKGMDFFCCVLLFDAMLIFSFYQPFDIATI